MNKKIEKSKNIKESEEQRKNEKKNKKEWKNGKEKEKKKFCSPIPLTLLAFSDRKRVDRKNEKKKTEQG